MTEQTRHIDVWDNCLHIIEQIIDPHQFNTWFRPVRALSLVDSTLTVEVPSDFFREYLDSIFLDVIRKTLQRVIGSDARLVYKVSVVQSQPAMKVPAAFQTAPADQTMRVAASRFAGSPNPFVYPGLVELKVDPRLNPVYCFENLVKGECNTMGISAGVSISDAPGKTPFNPLFIFGGPGLGKTHLAQAIGLSIKDKFPERKVLYVTGNQFKTQYMNATSPSVNQLTAFMAYYMSLDVLIVDDIQEMMGPGNQMAFFNIFNHLHQNGKQLILTSDRAPAELQNFEERMLSRFKWGLAVELTHPDYSTRLAMLKARCFREGVTIQDDVLEYLATHVKTNFRELEGALISLIAHATFAHRDNSLELAAHILDNLIGEDKNDISIDKVQRVVCDYFSISRETLLSKSRKRQIVQARQIAMYMSRNLITGCSLSTIGAEIGGKDHATVLHACNTVQDLMSTDRVFKKYVTDIESRLVSKSR